ncbi:MAG: hypothetical protein HY236_09100 [Acidobacteria bacterium]|nr:hypothetical protein [Acidobacteriota bacterium]
MFAGLAHSLLEAGDAAPRQTPRAAAATGKAVRRCRIFWFEEAADQFRECTKAEPNFPQEPEASFAPHLSQILKRFKAQYVVVGHSIPATRRILVRFDGHVFLIDTGMLASYFQGRPSALEISGGEFKSIYVGEPPQLLAGGAAAKGQ